MLKEINWKKQKKKKEDNEKTKKELWGRLNEFQDIKEHQKILKKCQNQYLGVNIFFVIIFIVKKVYIKVEKYLLKSPK